MTARDRPARKPRFRFAVKVAVGPKPRGPGEGTIRYERLTDLFRLAVRLQGVGGLTIDEIREEFAVSRRTAERMRRAVEHVFGPLESVDWDDGKRHWRLPPNGLRDLIGVSADELVELETAAAALRRSGRDEGAGLLRDLAAKLRALLRPAAQRRLEPDLEALMLAEGLAMWPGPRPRLEPRLLATLREAIKGARWITFRYVSRMTGRRSRQRVQPHGLLYGRRAYLVGRKGDTGGMRYWVLANMREVALADEGFVHDVNFDLTAFAEQSFGSFQEEPVKVVLRFSADVAADAGTFLFHPSQEIEKNKDGSLTVRFEAGGALEICWHLFTWGDSVTVEQPAELRNRLAGMCSALAEHHRAG